MLWNIRSGGDLCTKRVIDGLQYSFRVVIALVFQRVIFVYKYIDFLIVFYLSLCICPIDYISYPKVAAFPHVVGFLIDFNLYLFFHHHSCII